MTSFLLSCECRKQIPVHEGQAGRSVECSCGAKLTVPVLSELKTLPIDTTSSTAGRGPRFHMPSLIRRNAKVIIVVGVFIVLCGAVITYFIVSARIDAGHREQSRKNLVAIANALAECADFHGQRPPADGSEFPLFSKKGRGLSWRVHLLPFLKKNNLYNQVNLSEPWDSVHNKRLLKSMPAVYQISGSNAPPGYTHYRMFVGEGIPSTFFIVEAAEPVPWTKPAELFYDGKKVLPALGGRFGDGFHVLFHGGSLKFVSSELSPADLRALIAGERQP